MFDVPPISYAAVGDADVAYQVVGRGDRDLLLCLGLGSHLALQWEHPSHAKLLVDLSSFGRLIMLDRRGTGMSDRLVADTLPSWEEWTEDILAVLDAVRSRRAALIARLDAGPMAIMCAALHPERVSALVLAGTSARFLAAPDYPMGVSDEVLDGIVELIRGTWGTPELSGLAHADDFEDPSVAAWWSRMVQSSVTPRSAAAQYRHILRGDIRQALGLVHAPTLILHHTENPVIPIEQARFLAQHISNAQLIELPGASVGAAWRPFLDEIRRFLTGEHPPVEYDRVLTTVLFTDIVDSTARVAALGDRRWRSVLDAHDRVVREHLGRFGGREINTTGDGFHASFDGPARAIRCAQAITANLATLGIAVRVGIHTGECEVRGNDLAGLAVHIAARVGGYAHPSEVLVSRTVTDLVAGSGIAFCDRGEHVLKGVPGTWKLFAVEG